MGDFLELGEDGGVELGDAMAVDVAPEGADAVDVATAFGVDGVHAGGGEFDDDGVGFFDPGFP